MKSKNVIEELSRHPEGTFLDVIDFNDRSVGACSIQGESPVWEMHPDTDELFYVLEGEAQLTLKLEDGDRLHRIPAGSLFVVPRGIWHKPAAPEGVKFIYLTPGTSLHSEDPEYGSHAG